ncbi:MAG: hypothetical protein AMXMBFR79_06980 [Chitinophagaceae bacterium]
MKLRYLIIFFFMKSVVVFAQNDKATNYIKLYKDAAIINMQKTGVPASIILAQGMLESGYGESELCKKSNNHFGLKCKNDWNGEKVFYDDDEKQECFRAYPSALESYEDHSAYLKSRSWYAFLFELDPKDYENWAKGLKKAGYATEKDYAGRLIKLINDYNLQQYTLAALDKTVEVRQDDEKNNHSYEEKETENTTTATQQQDTTIEEENTSKETVTTPIKKVLTDTISNKKLPYNPDSIFTINHTKVIYALEGTSTLVIANKYETSLSTLFSFNDMKPIDLIDTNRLIFIERKMKKGAEDFYTIQNNETLYEVSQLKGVQLNSLLQYNKGLNKNSKLENGVKVYLRPLPNSTAPKKQIGG